MSKKRNFVPLSNPKMFSRIFGDEENIEILEAFLEDMLDYPRGYLRGRVRIVPKQRTAPYRIAAEINVDGSVTLIDMGVN